MEASEPPALGTHAAEGRLAAPPPPVTDAVLSGVAPFAEVAGANQEMGPGDSLCWKSCGGIGSHLELSQDLAMRSPCEVTAQSRLASGLLGLLSNRTWAQKQCELVDGGMVCVLRTSTCKPGLSAEHLTQQGVGPGTHAAAGAVGFIPFPPEITVVRQPHVEENRLQDVRGALHLLARSVLLPCHVVLPGRAKR